MSIINKVKDIPRYTPSPMQKQKSVYYILELQQNFSKIFALTSVRDGPNGLEPNNCLVRMIITSAALAVIGFGGWYLRIKYSYMDIYRTVQITDSIQCIGDVTQYVVDAYSAYAYGRTYLIEYFKHYENIDYLLEVDNYNKFKKNINGHLLFFMFFWTLSSSVDFAGWSLSADVFKSSLWTTSYMFVLLKIITMTEVTFHVTVLGCRLRHIANVIQADYHGTDSLHCETMDPLTNGYDRKNANNMKKVKVCPGLGIQKDSERVRHLSRCYMLLMTQSDYLNKAYGLRVLLCLVNFMTDILRWVNVAVLIMNGSKANVFTMARSMVTIVPLVSCILRILLISALLFSFMKFCERCYKERERIMRLLTLTLLNKSLTAPYRSALEEMRQVVSEQRLELTAFSVVRLDYALLQSMVSAIFTYTIILSQLSER